MLQNAYLLAKIGADTAENEQHFAENFPTGRRVRGACQFEAPAWAPAELAEALEAPEGPGPEQAGSLLIVFKEIKVTHM